MVCAAVVLYFTWYRWLPKDEAPAHNSAEPEQKGNTDA